MASPSCPEAAQGWSFQRLGTLAPLLYAIGLRPAPRRFPAPCLEDVYAALVLDLGAQVRSECAVRPDLQALPKRRGRPRGCHLEPCRTGTKTGGFETHREPDHGAPATWRNDSR